MMKLSTLYISGAFLLSFAAGCSNSTTPSSAPQVNYTNGSKYVYTQQTLDAKTGTPSGGVDTVTSLVLQTGVTFQGMSNATDIQNTHTHPFSTDTVDTTYIAQSNGDYWHYNYGIEILNSNAAVLNTANSGKPINAGWVLQAKLGSNPGDKWVALNTNLNLSIGTATLIDTATEANDTTIMVGTSQISAKHSIHSITLSALAGAVKANLIVDTYVSTADGMVLDIDHPTTLESSPTPGRITVFLGSK